ncbi:site-specific integrase [Paraburkholderia dilworthii]|uniref:Core-binding (CB) domain-containing protein n=1 Tax=Paraburkholderia dilworthii TaxID=948106 RepID=A0ABW9DHI1_9BURK
MGDIDAHATVTDVLTTSGIRVSCDAYLAHSEFSHDNELCGQLHYTFLQYAANRSSSKGLELRKAIVIFLDFLQKYNQLSPSVLHLNSVSDLTGDVFRQFERYLQKERQLGKLTARAETPLARLKGALNFVAKHTGGIPSLLLPAIRYDRSNKTEPLDESTFSELQYALKSHVDGLRIILENRIKVDLAESYTFDELVNIVNPPITGENLVQWYQFFSEKNDRRPDGGKIKYYLNKSDDPTLILMREISASAGELTRAWMGYYEGAGAKFKLPKPANPFETNLRNLRLNEFRVLKTLMVHGYPLKMSLQKLERFGSRMEAAWYKRTGHVLECILPYYLHRSTATAGRLTLTQILNKYYPSYGDMAVIVVFIMVQTGWNRETVVAIDPKNFESSLSGLLIEEETIIFSEKNRSQGNELPYYAPKLFKAISSKSNKYSAYNLIKLAVALTESFSGFSFDFDVTGADTMKISELFVGLRSSSAWLQAGRFYSLSAESLFNAGVSEFLAKYAINSGGRRLSKVEELTPKIRPTWIMMHRKEKPLSLISLIQGHDNTETTDIYYDSSGLAMKERRTRLRGELETVAHLLRTRQFTGLVGKAPSSADLKAGLTIFFFPGHEKGLWGCRNQFAPDWPGFEQRVQVGQKCTPSVNCLFCSQCYIFEDSLPYLIDRHAQIEEVLSDVDESAFSSSLHAEREVIDWLISNWSDDHAVQSAFAYQQRHTPLFPVDHTVFDVLFDDSEASLT